MPKNPANPSEPRRYFQHLVEVFSGRKRRQNVVVAEQKGTLPFEKGQTPSRLVRLCRERLLSADGRRSCRANPW